MNKTIQKTRCPYCNAETLVELPKNYAPRYVHCNSCTKKFIMERLSQGFKVMTIEDAPCCSDPDCRDIEMGGADEQ